MAKYSPEFKLKIVNEYLQGTLVYRPLLRNTNFQVNHKLKHGLDSINKKEKTDDNQKKDKHILENLN